MICHSLLAYVLLITTISGKHHGKVILLKVPKNSTSPPPPPSPHSKPYVVDDSSDSDQHGFQSPIFVSNLQPDPNYLRSLAQPRTFFRNANDARYRALHSLSPEEEELALEQSENGLPLPPYFGGRPRYAYYWLPRPTVFYIKPAPCTPDGGLKCCSTALGDFIKEVLEDPKKKDDFKNCNVQRMVNVLQTQTQQRFNKSFEAVVGSTDLAAKVHPLGDLYCKTKSPDGRFILLYATATQYDITN